MFSLQTEPGDKLSSDHSIPEGLALKESGIIHAGTGVFAEERFERGVRFGPYDGEIIPECDELKAHASGYCWLVSSCACNILLLLLMSQYIPCRS